MRSGTCWLAVVRNCLTEGTMRAHLEVLKRLMQQTATYELRAGLDLYRDPMTLMRLLNEAEGAQRWPGL